MNRIYIIILLSLLSMATNAQRISMTFNDVSLSDALRMINEQSADYTIHFIYNDLEDYRVTTTVSKKTLPEAIKQIIGFYPVRMTVTTDDAPEARGKRHNQIIVEPLVKTSHNLTGTVIDETGEPVAFANIALLSLRDSTLLAGGVTNESGYFAIPYQAERVLARISYVGYKTEYLLCDKQDAGTIRLKPESYTINGVTVKGHRLVHTSTARGLNVPVKDTPLEQYGSVTEMLTHLPLMMSDGTIAGQRGTPEIYVNNRKIRDVQELDRLRAEDILAVEIITNPGAEYGANVTSVIRLKTVRKAGEGLSGSFSASYRRSNRHYASINASLNYRTRNGMDFFVRGYLTDNNTLIDANSQDQLQASSVWDYAKSATWQFKMKYYFADLGWNWELNDRHSVGFTYSAFNYLGNSTTRREMEEQTWRDGILADGGHSMTNTVTRPHMTHTLNAYYVGSIGTWNIDFSADFYDAKSVYEMSGGTEGSTSVSSNTNTKNRLVAEKLVVTAPLKNGNLTFGEEVSAVDRTHDFVQSGFSADNHVRQQTSVWSLFADYSAAFGKLSLNAGLRWQNEHNLYYISGERITDMSPDYSILVPRISLAYNAEAWHHKLAYNCSRYNPPYSLLSSSVNYRSKYEYDTGNPLLKPQTSHVLTWSTQWKWLYAEVFYQYYKNSIRSFQTAYDDINHPGVVIMDYRNTPKQQYYGLTINFTPKFWIWQLNYTASLYFCNDDVYPLGITHKWNGLVADFVLDNTLTLPLSWLLNVKGGFTPYSESGVSKTKNTGFLDLRLSKQLLKDKSLSIAVMANDIFHTQYTERTAYGGINIRTSYREYRDSRKIGLDLSWRFNATRSRYKGSHAGQSERDRLR